MLAITIELTPPGRVLPDAPDPAEERAMSPGSQPTYVIGVDYGTLSGRAVVVRVADGAELGSAVYEYPHAVLTEALPDGTRLGHDWALQVPGDYLDVLRYAVPAAVSEAGIDPAQVVGIGTDFTACTMVPTLDDGTPLSELPELAGRPEWEFAKVLQTGNKVMRTLRAIKRRAAVAP
jgi:ribulose kinase